jgi:hypothetical protein
MKPGDRSPTNVILISDHGCTVTERARFLLGSQNMGRLFFREP